MNFFNKRDSGSRPNLAQRMMNRVTASEYKPFETSVDSAAYKADRAREKDKKYNECKEVAYDKARSVYDNSVAEGKKKCKDQFYPDPKKESNDQQPESNDQQSKSNGGKKHSKRNKSKKTRKNKSKKTRKKHRKFKKY